jgi:hypothetical protein
MPRKKVLKLSESEINDSVTEKSSDGINITENKVINHVYNDEDIIEINQLKGKEIWHYSMLEKFFLNCELQTIEKMVDIINGNHLISLRFLDWFVTRFCYLYKININVNNKLSVQKNFNINISYKAQLKSFTKKYFDPFKRKKKFIFTLDKFKMSFLTTLGQLNFFRWAISNDVIHYTETNYREIVSKYEHVNKFFKKHSSNSSSNSKNTSSNLSSCDLTNGSNSQDNNSIVNGIYKNNNANIIIDNTSNKSNFKMPVVHRNICIEL